MLLAALLLACQFNWKSIIIDNVLYGHQTSSKLYFHNRFINCFHSYDDLSYNAN